MVSTLMGTPTDEQMKVGHSWSSQDPRIHKFKDLRKLELAPEGLGTCQKVEQAPGWPPGGQLTVLSTRPVGEEASG